MVGRLVEQQEVRWLDPEQRKLEPRAFAARQHADLLECVVATEQEPGEVCARIAGGDRGGLGESVEDSGARDRRAAQLRQVPDLDGVPE